MKSENITKFEFGITLELYGMRNKHKGASLWFTGLSVAVSKSIDNLKLKNNLLGI